MLPPPTHEQQTVLDDLGLLYLQNGKWPRWAWLEEKLDARGFDALGVFQSFPSEFSVGYGYIWPDRPTGPGPNDRIGLTVAGLSYVQPAQNVVSAFLHLLDAFASFRSRIALDPYNDSQPIGTRESILRGRFPSISEPLVIPLLTHEPPTWHITLDSTDGTWTTAVLPAELRRFAGVRDVPDYLERLASYLLPPTIYYEPPPPSPFTLPAAIDYLDAIWQLRYGRRLVMPPGVERSARLAFTATSPEEADSRLSALAELLGGLEVPGTPGVNGHPLERLGPFLDADLPAEALDRVHQAIAVLNSARIVRVGAQHHRASPHVVAAFAELGLSYPVADWSLAWQHTQNEVANAFNAIRDELQAAPARTGR